MDFRPPPIYIPVAMPADSAPDDTVAQKSFGALCQDVEPIAVVLTPDGNVPADGTDAVTVTIKAGGSALAVFTTDSDESGYAAWVDNASQKKTPSIKKISASQSSPAQLSIDVAKAGSGKQLPTYAVTVVCQPLEHLGRL